jgi:hypothetical protein
MRKNSKKIKIITITCVVLIILAIALPLLLSIYIYQSVFGNRYETTAYRTRNINEFDNLKRERYVFDSNDGQNLIEYKYYKESESVKGIVIMAHGLGGGGHNSCMDVPDYLAASKARIMLIHSADNDTISFENNFLKFYDLFNKNPRFVFVGLEGRGHNYVYHSDFSKTYREEYNQKFTEYVESTGAEINAELESKYMNENGNKSMLFELDTELMDRIVLFYNSYLK